jgi:Tfp pilus assembly PilM family ATPase
MSFDMFKRLGSIGKKAQSAGSNAGQSVADAFGLKPGTSNPIAIDFGAGALKLLQVDVKGGVPHLVAAACLQTPEDLVHDHNRRLDFQIEALPRLIRKGGFRGRRAVCAIPAWGTLCRHLQFPKADGLKTSDLVGGAIAMQLQLDPAGVVYRHIEVSSSTPGKVEVVCIAVARDLVGRLMKAIGAAKLDPVGMHSEFHAVLASVDPGTLKEEAGSATLYLDMGTLTTKVMIAHGDKIEFARLCAFGARHMDEMVSKQLQVQLSDARRERDTQDQRLQADPEGVLAELARLHASRNSVNAAAVGSNRAAPAVAVADPSDQSRVGSRDFAPPQPDLTEAVETLTDEINMCTRYYATQGTGKRVERVVFLGGESRHKGLCQQIAKKLRLTARMVDPMTRVGRAGSEPAIGVDLKEPQPAWAAVLGMCLSPTDL